MASPRSLVWHDEENRSDEDLPASKQFYKKKKEKRETKKKKKKFERPFQLSRVIHLAAFLTINPPPGARKKLSDGQQLKFVPVFTGETINGRHCSLSVPRHVCC